MKTQAERASVLIADHDRTVRQALRLLCEEGLNLFVAAEAADGAGLCASLRGDPVAVAVVEWELPGLDPQALFAAQSARVIALSADPNMRDAALKAGAYGFVYKGDPPTVLVHLLRAAIDAERSDQ